MGVGTDSINAFVPGALFLRNALAGGRESRYPGDNLFPEMDRFSQQIVAEGRTPHHLIEVALIEATPDLAQRLQLEVGATVVARECMSVRGLGLRRSPVRRSTTPDGVHRA